MSTASIIGIGSELRLGKESAFVDVYCYAPVSPVNAVGFKLITIHIRLGRQPVLAFSNLDGDLQMFQYVGGGDVPKLLAVLQHYYDKRAFAATQGAKKLPCEAQRPDWLRIGMRD